MLYLREFSKEDYDFSEDIKKNPGRHNDDCYSTYIVETNDSYILIIKSEEQIEVSPDFTIISHKE